MGTGHKMFLAAGCALLFSAVAQGAVLAAATNAQIFAQRVADNGRPEALTAVLTGLPPGWTSPVPLPTAMPLLGSVSQTAEHSVEIFYQPVDAQSAYNAYTAQLRAAGFAPSKIPAPAFNSGGFTEARTVPFVTLFCRGPQGLDVMIPDPKSDDLRVTVLSDERTPFNSCLPRNSEPGQQYANPLPQLVAPDGVTLVTALSGNSTFGYSAVGVSGTVSSTVLLQGSPDAVTIADTYARQFEHAGWRETGAMTSKSSALATFDTTFQGQIWTAMLALYPGMKAHQYVALLSASGKPVVGSPTPPVHVLPAVLPRIKKSDEPAVLQLVERNLNFDGTNRVGVYLHRAPPQFPANLPLPRGDLLGSTIVAPAITPDSGAEPYINVFYELTQRQLESYLQVLQKQGWREQQSPLNPAAGFVPTSPTPYAYCRLGMPGLNISAAPNSNAVTLSTNPTQIASSCHAVPAPPPPPETSLPKLHAPGLVVSRWTTEGFGNAASFTSTAAPGTLLDLFARQLQQVGWQPGSRAANDNVGTQSFTHTDTNGKRSEASLTLYRYTGTPAAYGAVLDVTNMP